MKAFILEKKRVPTSVCMECIQNNLKTHTKPAALEAGKQKEKECKMFTFYNKKSGTHFFFFF